MLPYTFLLAFSIVFLGVTKNSVTFGNDKAYTDVVKK